ncbi:MAG: CHAP domain-containing protein, partial [Oscillospiraceae bacterium]|nr:CHAP domain-containing protein [Oscillospiraceae bacterium]
MAEASVPEAPAAAPVETPQEAPAEPPAAGGTDDSQGEPAEAPQTEPAEAPQAEPADETTDDTQDEPQPEAGEQSEQTGDASEGAGEAAQENAAALALSGLKADAESAAVGQTIRWTFEASGAESVSWKAVGADGATAGQGDCEDGAFTWTPAESGIYTVTVTASAGEQSLTEDAKITVRDGALSVSVTPGARYGVANEKEIDFAIALTGGVKPWSVSAEIGVGGEIVTTLTEVPGTVHYMPLAFGVHTFTLIATDAEGTVATASASVPVAVNEREKAADWQKGFPTLRADQTYAEKLIAIADSQLGYAESERNFIIAEDGKQQGYTRYGDWYDRDYEEWSAMFVAFCLHYAEIPDNAMPGYETAQKWMEKLKDDYIADVDNYQPEPGDLIFFELDAKDGMTPDHMGIVTSADEKTIYTIEGNSEKSVRECRYTSTDNTIVGYASLRAVMEKHDRVYQEKQAAAQPVMAAAPAKSAEQPAEGGEETTDDGEETADDGEETTDDGEETTDDGEETADDGEETADDGEETADDGEETTDDGEETTDDGEEPTDDGEETVEDGEDAKSADGASPYTIEPITGEDERWAAIEALMPAELTMLAAYDITGVIEDEEAGVEVTIPGVALEDPENTLLLHFPSLEEGAEPEKVDYKYDEETGDVVFTVFGFSAYALAQQAPPLLRAGAPVERTIQIDLCDMAGNALTSVPGGSFTLYAYEVPIAELEPYQSYSSPEEMQAMFNVYRSHETRLTVNSVGMQYTLTMEADASAENPYLVMFDANGLPDVSGNLDPRTGGVNYPVSDWVGTFGLTYDGENVTLNGQYGYRMTEDADGVLHGTVYHDDSRKTPSLKLKTDTTAYSEDSDYPVYAQITLVTQTNIPGDDYYGLTHIQTVTQTVSADGTIDVTFPDAISTYAVRGLPRSTVTVKLYTDAACTQETTTWTNTTALVGSSYNYGSAVTPGSDGVLHALDESNGTAGEDPFIVSFEKQPPVQKTLEISAYDLNENPLTDSDIPAAGLTIYYYAFAERDMPIPVYYPGSSQDDWMQQVYQFLKECENTLVLTAQSQEYTLTMPASATAQNSYYYMFSVNPIAEPTSGSSYGPFAFSSENSEWSGNFGMRWNGTEVTPQNGMTMSEDGKVHGKVYHDTTLTNVSLTVNFDASAYTSTANEEDGPAYPIYAVATMNSLPASNTYSAGLEQTLTLKVEADGVVTFQFPEKVSTWLAANGRPYNATVTLDLYSDEACTEPVPDWTLTNYAGTGGQNGATYSFPAIANMDGTLHGMGSSSNDIGTMSLLLVKATDFARVSIPVALVDDNGWSRDEDFPVYLALDLSYTDDNGINVTQRKVVQIDSPVTPDENGGISVSDFINAVFDAKVPKDRTFTLNSTPYKDEACTVVSYSWYTYGENTLVYDETEQTLKFANWNQKASVVLNYSEIELSLGVDPYTTDPDNDYPAYVKVELRNNNSSSPITFYNGSEQITYSAVVPITGNQVEPVSFPRINYNYNSPYSFPYYFTLYYAVYSDEACTQLHPGWNTEVSMNVYINQNKGELYYDDYYQTMSAIPLQHVTFEDVTVPMNVELGNLSEADYFPVTLQANVTGLTADGEERTLTITRTLNSLADVADLVFEAPEGTHLSATSGRSYTLDFAFYTDETLENIDSEWSSGSIPCDLTRNGTLAVSQYTYNGYSGSEYPAAVGIYMRPVSAEVAPQANPDELTVDAEHPISVRLEASNGRVIRVARESRTDLEPFTVDFPQLTYVMPDLTGGECWNIYAQVTSTEISAVDAPGWVPDPESGTYDAYSSMEGKLQVGRSVPIGRDRWNQIIYGTRYFDLTLMPKYMPEGVEVSIPVHANVPEGETDPYTYDDIEGGEELLFVKLLTIDEQGFYVPYFADEQRDHHSEYDVRYYYHWTEVANLDADNRGVFDDHGALRLSPGTYYVTWFMGTLRDYYGNGNYNYGDVNYRDPKWAIPDQPVKIIVGEDGVVRDEAGNPYTIEVEYLGETLIQPEIDVTTTYPANYKAEGYEWNLYKNGDYENPYGFTVNLKPLFEDPNGRYSWEKDIPFRFEWYDYTSGYYENGSWVSGHNVYHWYDLVPDGSSYIGAYDEYHRYARAFQFADSENPNPEKPTVAGIYSDAYWSSDITFQYYPNGIYAPNFTYYDNRYDPDKVSFQGFPVGDYELSYNVIAQRNSSTTYYDSFMDSEWWSSDKVKVHLAEDGKIYKILSDGSYESSPYVIDIHYLGEAGVLPPSRELDEITVKVNTVVADGVGDAAFTEGDAFQAILYEYTDRQIGRPIAFAEQEITQTGEITLALHAYEPTVGSDKIPLYNDPSYLFVFGTVHNADGTPKLLTNGALNKDWAYCTGTTWWLVHGSPDPNYTGTSGHWSYYDSTTHINEAGEIISRIPMRYNTATSVVQLASLTNNSFGEFEPFTIQNVSMLLPWSTVSPENVYQNPEAEDALIFKPITKYTQLKDKSHYIFVTQNPYDNCWYALAYDANGGHQVRLDDVTSLDDLKNGYMLSESAIGTSGNFVFTANSVKHAEESAEAQLKTNVLEGDKAVSLKLGTSAANLEPLFSTSAGNLIMRNSVLIDEEAATFQLWKNGYACLYYLPELFGKSGFGVSGWNNGSARTLLDLSTDGTYFWLGSGYYGSFSDYIARQPGMDQDFNTTFRYLANTDYLSDPYRTQFMNYFRSMTGVSGSAWNNATIPYTKDWIVLSDNLQEDESAANNTYTLVKTFGDFVNTFINNNGSSASMLLVYTDGEGNEYAMNPKGSKQVASTPGANGYSKIIAGADNELIPNNNSGTSSTFGFVQADVVGGGAQVFANSYAFRKSRQNNAQNREYLTLNGESAWSRTDDGTHGDGLIYVLHPSSTIHSQADWDTSVSYKLEVVRYGQTSWLGIEDGEMVTVSSESEAVSFRVYSLNLSRYYSSAYGSDLYTYYRVHSMEDINEGDEILIVYNDGETRHLLAGGLMDSRYNDGSSHYYNDSYGSPQVLDSYSILNSNGHDYPKNARYMYRLNTEGYVKKPWAYVEELNDEGTPEIIKAQGVSSNAIGTAKTENDKQRKYRQAQSM